MNIKKTLRSCAISLCRPLHGLLTQMLQKEAERLAQEAEKLRQEKEIAQRKLTENLPYLHLMHPNSFVSGRRPATVKKPPDLT